MYNSPHCIRFNNWPSVAHWDQTKKIKNQLNQELGMERPHISHFLLFLKLDLFQLFFPGLDRGFCRYFLTKLNFSLRLTGQYRMPPFKCTFCPLFLDAFSQTKSIFTYWYYVIIFGEKYTEKSVPIQHKHDNIFFTNFPRCLNKKCFSLFSFE